MAGYGRFLAMVRRIISGVVVFMLALLVIIVLTAVFFRYVLNDSITWSSEVARYMCIWVGFLSASLIVANRGHLGLEFVVKKMPEPATRLIRLISDSAILAFLAVILYQGIKLAIFQLEQNSPSLEISMFWPYASVPVFACLMALEFIHLVCLDINDLKRSGSEGK